MDEGKKFDNGKPRVSLVPMEPLLELADLYSRGARKYGDNNWTLGIKWSRIFDALMRHTSKWWNGEDYDAEDGQHHMAAVAWCAFTLLEYKKTRPEFDDRLKKPAYISINVSKLSYDEINTLAKEIEKKIDDFSKNNSQNKNNS